MKHNGNEASSEDANKAHGMSVSHTKRLEWLYPVLMKHLSGTSRERGGFFAVRP